jgi:tetratricopeptide (TPR) repeat protein
MHNTIGTVQIADLIRNRELVIFPGAGVSMAPPSILPSFLDLQNEVLWALSSGQNTTRGWYEDVHEQIKNRDYRSEATKKFTDLMPEYVYQVCLDQMGERALDSLDALKSAVPNANHHFLAGALRKGYLPLVLTTNFDTLIEDAFLTDIDKSAGVRKALRVACSPYDHAIDAGGPQLLKLHGSIGSKESLAVSLRQIGLRCVSPGLEVLKKILEKYYVLFTGYRGSDLDVFACMATVKCKGVIWNARNKDSLIPKIGNLLTSVSGKLIFQDLNVLLKELAENLGVEVPESGPSPGFVSPPSLASAMKDWAAAIHDKERLAVLGNVWSYVGDAEKALLSFEEGQVLCNCRKDDNGEAFFLGRIATVHYEHREYVKAEAACLQQLKLAEHWPLPLRLYENVHVLQMLGLIKDKTGVHPKKVLDDYLIQALRSQEELEKIDPPSRRLKADILVNIADVFFRNGHAEESLKGYTGSLALYDEVGDVHGRARSLSNLGSIYLFGKLDKAAFLYQEAAYLFGETNDIISKATVLYNLALCLREKGNMVTAAGHASESIRLYKAQGDLGGIRKVKLMIEEIRTKSSPTAGQ